MSDPDATAVSPTRTGQSLPRWFPRRRLALLWLSIAAVAAGLFFGWDWLVAAGFGPIIVSVLPCAAMCALGLCAMRAGVKRDPADDNGAAPTANSSPTQRRS